MDLIQKRQILVYGIILVMGISALWGCAGQEVYSKAGTRTTVILIRHADRDELIDHLNDKGRRRAQALVMAVGHLPITAIYSPDLKRNIETARPLADKLGIDVTLTDKMGALSVGEFVEMILSRHAGETVLCVGNASANIPALYNRLGGDGLGPMEYGQLAILTITETGKTVVKRTHFGE